MKNKLLILLLILTTLKSTFQTVEWFKEYNKNQLLRVSNDEYLFMASSFSGNIIIELGDANYNLTNNFCRNFLIAKYSNNGNLLWANN